jgi:adhesin transport system outer membrane protein
MQRLTFRHALLIATALIVAPRQARSEQIDLKAAVEAAMQTHPEINQAVENKDAIEFEREQAQARPGSAGLKMQRADL